MRAFSSNTLTTAQASVTAASSVSLVGENRYRYFLYIYNSGTIGLSIGFTSGVTAATGHIIPANSGLTIEGYTGPVWGILLTTGTNTVSVAETS